MLETQSSGGSPRSFEESSTRGSRPVPTVKPLARAGHIVNRHGSLSRTRRRFARNVEGTRTGAMGSFPSRIRPCARVVCRRSEEPAFRKGRAHDRIVVAEVGRTASSSWTRAAPGNRGGVPKRNAARGNPRGASERPADGRRSGSSVLAAIVTDRRGRVILAARSQTPPRFPMREGGSPPVGPTSSRRTGGAR
jgi:hypothetical protein